MQPKHRTRQGLFPWPEVQPVRANTMTEFAQVIQKHGHLITPSLAAQFIKVSPARIYNLIDEGRLTKIVVYGVIHVPLTQVNRIVWERMQKDVTDPHLRKGVEDGTLPLSLTGALPADSVAAGQN